MKNTAPFKDEYYKQRKWQRLIAKTKQSKPIVTERGMVLWGKSKKD